MLNRGVGILALLIVASACASTVSQPPPLPNGADAATFDTSDIGSDVPVNDRPSRDVPDSGPSRLVVREGVGYLRRLGGSTVAWGDQSALLGGTLDDAGTADPGARTVPTTSSKLFLGFNSACTLDDAATVRCWGDSAVGQVGNGEYHPVAAPGPIVLDQVADVASGFNSWCALKRDGSVWCWGLYASNAGGDSLPGPTPVRIDLPPIFRIFGGGRAFHYNGIDASGRIWCWGDQTQACVEVDQRVALRGVAIGTVPDVMSIALGRDFSCAVSWDGGVRCWGSNIFDLLNEPPASRTGILSVPTPARLYEGAVALTAGDTFLCALMPSGSVLCGGTGSQQGVLGYYSVPDLTVHPPMPIPTLGDVIEIGAGREHNCALTRADEVFCWGSNVFHQLGQPPPRMRSDVPLLLPLP